MGILKKYPAITIGLVITLLFLYFLRAGFLDTMGLTAYDVMMRWRGDPESQSPVVMVDIDDDSIEKLGRWPWPRSLIAQGIEKINSGDPKGIGLNIIFSEPEESAGLAALKELETLFSTTFPTQVDLVIGGDQLEILVVLPCPPIDDVFHHLLLVFDP